MSYISEFQLGADTRYKSLIKQKQTIQKARTIQRSESDTRIKDMLIAQNRRRWQKANVSPDQIDYLINARMPEYITKAQSISRKQKEPGFVNSLAKNYVLADENKIYSHLGLIRTGAQIRAEIRARMKAREAHARAAPAERPIVTVTPPVSPPRAAPAERPIVTVTPPAGPSVIVTPPAGPPVTVTPPPRQPEWVPPGQVTVTPPPQQPEWVPPGQAQQQPYYFPEQKPVSVQITLPKYEEPRYKREPAYYKEERPAWEKKKEYYMPKEKPVFSPEKIDRRDELHEKSYYEGALTPEEEEEFRILTEEIGPPEEAEYF